MLDLFRARHRSVVTEYKYKTYLTFKYLEKFVLKYHLSTNTSTKYYHPETVSLSLDNYLQVLLSDCFFSGCC